jgi:8-oxo-dGTP diphosphatase
MTDPDDRPPIAAAVIVNDRRLLLVERRVKEGSLSWQFPAGEVESGESFEQAAVREAHEETGLIVEASRLLGERIHPKTGRRMGYVACHVISGAAHVADTDELLNVAWVAPDEFDQYVPYGFAPDVVEYLDAALPAH